MLLHRALSQGAGNGGSHYEEKLTTFTFSVNGAAGRFGVVKCSRHRDE